MVLDQKVSITTDDTFDDREVLVENRPKLKKYLGFGDLDFYAVYGYRSINHNGTEIACIKDVRDPLNHDVIANHIWIFLNKDMVKTLSNLPQGTPIKIHGKVVLYSNKTKVGIHVRYINLIKGMRTYKIESRKISKKFET